jgi:hypothetical protein
MACKMRLCGRHMQTVKYAIQPKRHLRAGFLLCGLSPPCLFMARNGPPAMSAIRSLSGRSRHGVPASQAAARRPARLVKIIWRCRPNLRSVLLRPTLSFFDKRCSGSCEGDLLSARRLATSNPLSRHQQFPIPSVNAAGLAIGAQPDFGVVHNISSQKIISYKNNLD